MGVLDAFNRRRQIASYQKAEDEGRVGGWIVWKIITAILTLPARIIWRWTDKRTQGTLAHLIQFLFFTALAYLLPILIVVSLFK